MTENMCEQCCFIALKPRQKRFCSRKCLNDWQRTVTLEEKVGYEKAALIKQKRSEKMTGDNNPSKNPDVAGKISNSLKEYLKDNPRLGARNPFYNKHHDEETKKHLSDTKKGKRSYTDTQYEKLLQNTFKGDKCHFWKGGISFEEYGKEWNKKLKTFIKNNFNNSCFFCYKTECILAVHHIDYNKQNCSIKNLIPLCRSCHAKTNFNREQWIIFINDLLNV